MTDEPMCAPRPVQPLVRPRLGVPTLPVLPPTALELSSKRHVSFNEPHEAPVRAYLHTGTGEVKIRLRYVCDQVGLEPTRSPVRAIQTNPRVPRWCVVLVEIAPGFDLSRTVRQLPVGK